MQHASLACMLSRYALPLSAADTPVRHGLPQQMSCSHVLSSRLQAERMLIRSCMVLQGESFDFGTPVVIDGAVEVWMSAVEKEMRTTLNRSGMILTA